MQKVKESASFFKHHSVLLLLSIPSCLPRVLEAPQLAVVVQNVKHGSELREDEHPVPACAQFGQQAVEEHLYWVRVEVG